MELEWLKVTPLMDNSFKAINLTGPRCSGLRRDIYLNVFGNVPDLVMEL